MRAPLGQVPRSVVKVTTVPSATSFPYWSRTAAAMVEVAPPVAITAGSAEAVSSAGTSGVMVMAVVPVTESAVAVTVQTPAT